MRILKAGAVSISAVAGLLLAGTAFVVADDIKWSAQQVDGKRHSKLTAETRPAARNGLPDGLVAKRKSGDIQAAWYEAPTRRYAHGILGDAIEAGTLAVLTKNGTELRLTLPDSEVFEDRTPRLADLNGDGSVEVITIRSSRAKGGAVTVYGLAEGELAQLATTDFIGRSNRWLNIAGIADFDGQPGLEIAHVRTPHIGGTLNFDSYRNGKLERIGSIDGFSNHAIGSREMRLSAVADVDGDGRNDIAVPADNRGVLRIITFAANGPVQIGSATLPSRIDKAVAVDGREPAVDFLVGLEDGSVWRVSR